MQIIADNRELVRRNALFATAGHCSAPSLTAS
jgi:hypothetical protein